MRTRRLAIRRAKNQALAKADREKRCCNCFDVLPAAPVEDWATKKKFCSDDCLGSFQYWQQVKERRA